MEGKKELEYIINHLREKKLIEGGEQAEGFIGKLTYDGWDKYDELKKSGIYTNKAFMAMKFGDEELDKFYNDYLIQAVAETGFKLERLDEIPQAGLINDNLRVSIRNSRFLLAELTHGNQGVYWEAGYAEGLEKHVIYLCEKSVFEAGKSHFDTNHHLTVIWEKGKYQEAIKKLKATIRVTLPTEAKMEDDEDKTRDEV